MLSKLNRKIQNQLKRILVEDSSAHSVGMGFAIGLFIGLLPIFGFQMIPAFFISMRFKVNKTASVMGVWITNPITFVPIYLFHYWLGTFLLPQSLVADIEVFRQFLEDPNTKRFLGLGMKTLLPLMVGCLISASVVSVAGYQLMKHIVSYRHKKKETHIFYDED